MLFTKKKHLKKLKRQCVKSTQNMRKECLAKCRKSYSIAVSSELFGYIVSFSVINVLTETLTHAFSILNSKLLIPKSLIYTPCLSTPVGTA